MAVKSGSPCSHIKISAHTPEKGSSRVRQYLGLGLLLRCVARTSPRCQSVGSWDRNSSTCGLFRVLSAFPLLSAAKAIWPSLIRCSRRTGSSCSTCFVSLSLAACSMDGCSTLGTTHPRRLDQPESLPLGGSRKPQPLPSRCFTGRRCHPMPKRQRSCQPRAAAQRLPASPFP